MLKIIKIIILIFTINCLFCNELPNDIRWVVKSKEYKNLCKQIYRHASSQLEKNKWYGQNYNRPAIIMDLDETVLDNSQYQVEIFNKGETFNMKSWSKWVKRSNANLVPGSKAFIKKARALGYQLIFISNRMHERLEYTKDNMKKLGIYNPNDIYLLRKNKKDTKDIRRGEVYKGTNRMSAYGPFNVVMYLGDAMGDFNRVKSHRENYIFPNPMYGKW